MRCDSELVKVMYATHVKLLITRFDYDRKRNKFYTLVRYENKFTIKGNSISIDVPDLSGLDEAEMFQQTCVWPGEYQIEPEVLQRYQKLLNSLMLDYPCEVGGSYQFLSKHYELP